MRWPSLPTSGLFSGNTQNFPRAICCYPQDGKESRSHCVLIFGIRIQRVLMGRTVSEGKGLTKQFQEHQVSNQLFRKENPITIPSGDTSWIFQNQVGKYLLDLPESSCSRFFQSHGSLIHFGFMQPSVFRLPLNPVSLMSTKNKGGDKPRQGISKHSPAFPHHPHFRVQVKCRSKELMGQLQDRRAEPQT